MKKILLTLITASLLLCSCTNNSLIGSYIERIKEQLEIKERDEWCYTYQKAEPQKNNAYLINFYVNSYTSSHSEWYCIKIENEIDCDLLYINYY